MKNLFDAIAKLFKTDPDRVDGDGLTRLQRAIINGDVSHARALIDMGADVNLRGRSNFPPLHLALLRDTQEIAEALIGAGADVNLRDGDGRTPLHYAASHGHSYLMRLLFHASADPNVRDNEGRTPLHVLSTAVPNDVYWLVSHGASVNAQDDDGNTPLHAFLKTPHMLKALVERGADPNIRNNRNVTPFSALLEEEDIVAREAVLRLFLSYGADLSSINSRGETLLFRAARAEMTSVFNGIIDASDLTARDRENNNILHALLRGQTTHMMTSVLSRRPALLQEKNGMGFTPLSEMIQRYVNAPQLYNDDKFALSARIMISYGADPNTVDADGNTLAHVAVRFGMTGLLDYLIETRADLNLRNERGQAPLHLALKGGSLDLVDRLLDAGADPDLTDDRGWTVLDHLAKKGDRDSPIVQRLIVAGGSYKKQLPLNPDLMRNRPRRTLSPPRRGEDQGFTHKKPPPPGAARP